MTSQERRTARACADWMRTTEHSDCPFMMGIADFLDRCAGDNPQAPHGNRPFWLVWNEAGQSGRPHATELEATMEAERLAMENKARFVILKSVCEFNPSGVKRTDHAPQ
jgi:hypothetical protein